MPKLRTDSVREGFLRRMHKKRLSYIAILPSLITLLNAISGFASIVLTSKGHFISAATMIFVGMIADMLDGRIARMSKSTSSFGGQLDSLCDVITFGLAPAFLMMGIMDKRLSTFVSTTLVSFMARVLWLVTATYISCAAIRLARFNVENEEDESAHMSFVGLPSPAAAGVIASMVIFHQDVLPAMRDVAAELHESSVWLYEFSNQLATILDVVIIYSLPFVTLGVAILMVSRIRYPHVVNQYMKGKKPFTHLIRVLLVLGLVFIFKVQTVLMLAFCIFTISGVVRWMYYKFFRKKQAGLIEPKAELSQETEQV